MLHIIPSLCTGGAETGVVRALQALDPARVEARLYVCRPPSPGELAVDGITLIRDARTGGAAGAAFRVARYIRRWRPDIVHLHLSLAGYLGARLAGAGKIIIHHHTGYPERLAEIRGLYLYETYLPRDVTVACSEAIYRQCLQVNRLQAEAVRLIPHGVDLDAFDALAAGRCWDGRLQRHGDEVLIVTLGRLVALKGLDVLLESLRLLPPEPRWRLVIAGDGEERGPLEALAAKLGLLDRVQFLGNVAAAEVPSLLRECDLMVQPSRREGLGLSAAEGSAAGLPVVASAVGGLPEVVADGETGLLVPPDDPPALAEGLLSLLQSPSLRRQMGANGRRRIEQRLSIVAVADELTRLYETLTPSAGVAGDRRCEFS